MKLTEVEIQEMEKITDEIIVKTGQYKGQIKKNAEPGLVERYNELSAKLEAPDGDSNPKPEPTPDPEPKKTDPVPEKELTEVEARKKLLLARLRNPGSKYTLAQRQTWRRELALMEQGRWTRPIAPKVSKGCYDDVVGG